MVSRSFVSHSLSSDTNNKVLTPSDEEVHRWLCLFQSTGLSMDSALKIIHEESTSLSVRRMIELGVTWNNIVATGLTIDCLINKHKLESIDQLVNLEMDSFDASEEHTARSLIAHFGADSVVSRFVKTPIDALAWLDSDAAVALQLDVHKFMQLCEGEPDCAAKVLSHYGCPSSSVKLSPIELLNTGLRANALRELGYTTVNIIESLDPRPTSDQIRLLGFYPRL